MSKLLNATVTACSEVTHGLFILKVEPDEPPSPFKAGQYAVLGLPGAAPRVKEADAEELTPDPEKLIRRAYSIASGSLSPHCLEFYVALVRGGALTPRLYALKPGDRIWVGPKIVGLFTLDDVPPGDDVIFVSTGTGLAPYISMLRSGYDFEARGRTVVVQGARQSWDLGYRNDLEYLAGAHERFAYEPLVSRPDNETTPWQGLVGRVTSPFRDGTAENLIGRPLTPEGLSIFLCGNPDMIMEMLDILGERDFREHTRKTPGQIFVEKYW